MGYRILVAIPTMSQCVPYKNYKIKTPSDLGHCIEYQLQQYFLQFLFIIIVIIIIIINLKKRRGDEEKDREKKCDEGNEYFIDKNVMGEWIEVPEK